MKKVIFSEEEKEEIINKYINEHMSMTDIGKEKNVSRTVISRILKENNIGMDINNKHKYYADYRKFKNIDDEDKAYWLGFIAADGCNYQREKNSSVIINIHKKDIGHLEKFKEFMNSNVNIVEHIQNEGFSNNTPMCKIVFNSKEMSKDLEDKGIVPRKSLILDIPKIDKKYYLPFILGYFDGDGSIFKSSQGNNYGINIEGTKEILEWINNILKISNKLEKRKDDETNNYYIRCGGTKKVYDIMNKLYSNCHTHLDRKYEIYKTLETVVLSGNTNE